VLADHETAPVGEPLRATLRFLRKVTLTPDEVAPEDGEAVRAAGASDEAIADALYVCFYFNLIDRIADALGFDLPSEAEHRAGATAFLAEGYGNEV
jgi:alkylhydroperoxidase family enzyme